MEEKKYNRKGEYMTTSGLIMMVAAWSIIIFFTAKFFIKVLKTPQRPDDE